MTENQSRSRIPRSIFLVITIAVAYQFLFITRNVRLYYQTSLTNSLYQSAPVLNQHVNNKSLSRHINHGNSSPFTLENGSNVETFQPSNHQRGNLTESQNLNPSLSLTNQDRNITTLSPEIFSGKNLSDINKTSLELTRQFTPSDITSNSNLTISPTLLNNTTTKEKKFFRYDNVAIVTKIHGPHQWKLVVQSMCLLHFAYNNQVLYDIIVFTAEPIPKEYIESLQKMLAPANVSIVIDNRGLQEEIAALTPARYKNFMERCNVSSPKNLTWFSNCRGELNGYGKPIRLAYAWQAEFRSMHIWHHPSLVDYKYMLWLDTDGFCTKPWKNDPVEYFIKNNGIIMFDHFPQGQAPGRIQPLILKAFNASVCYLRLNKQKGHLERTLIHDDTVNSVCGNQPIPNIHGFFHITNLDFYRSQPVKHGLETLIGDCFLCRSPDDQLSVTIPAAIFEPERSWEMRSKGFKLDVFHNFELDGIDRVKPPGFVKYWKTVAKLNLSSTDGMHTCPVTERD